MPMPLHAFVRFMHPLLRAIVLDRDGKAIDSFASVVSPADRRLVSEIERPLAT